jgi:hypothetical protein
MRDAQPVIRSLVKRVVEGPGRDGIGNRAESGESQSGLRWVEAWAQSPPPPLSLGLSQAPLYGQRGRGPFDYAGCARCSG